MGPCAGSAHPHASLALLPHPTPTDLPRLPPILPRGEMVSRPSLAFSRPPPGRLLRASGTDPPHSRRHLSPQDRSSGRRRGDLPRRRSVHPNVHGPCLGAEPRSARPLRSPSLGRGTALAAPPRPLSSQEGTHAHRPRRRNGPHLGLMVSHPELPIHRRRGIRHALRSASAESPGELPDASGCRSVRPSPASEEGAERTSPEEGAASLHPRGLGDPNPERVAPGLRRSAGSMGGTRSADPGGVVVVRIRRPRTTHHGARPGPRYQWAGERRP